MKRVWRWVRWPLAGVAVLLVLLGGLYWIFVEKFSPPPPSADYPKPANALEAQRQDLDYFRKLIAIDRSYAPAARAEANARLDALAKSNAVLDRGTFRVALMKVAALADNGHTSIHSVDSPTGRSRLLPLRLSAFADGVYVMRVEKPNSDLLAAKVTAIDGHPIEEVIATLSQTRGGTQAFRRNFAELFLNASDILHGAGVSPSAERSNWTFLTADGKTVTRNFTAYQPAYKEPSPDMWRWMSPEKVRDDKHDWAAATHPGPVPFAWLDGDTLFRRAWLNKSCILYIQLRANEGDGIGDFLRATEAEMEARKPCAIILDNRFNGGGDYTNTAGFAGRLPGHLAPHGHIYVITGVETFSAGITTTVFVKQATPPAQFTQLGEPVGDRMIFWAEGGSGCLPHAQFCFHYSPAMHDYIHGCTEWDKCYWVNRVFPARTPNLDLAETITMSFGDWKAGRDPVLDRAIALASKNAN
jgi:hypothetical protein